MVLVKKCKMSPLLVSQHLNCELLYLLVNWRHSRGDKFPPPPPSAWGRGEELVLNSITGLGQVVAQFQLWPFGSGLMLELSCHLPQAVINLFGGGCSLHPSSIPSTPLLPFSFSSPLPSGPSSPNPAVPGAAAVSPWPSQGCASVECPGVGRRYDGGRR